MGPQISCKQIRQNPWSWPLRKASLKVVSQLVWVPFKSAIRHARESTNVWSAAQITMDVTQSVQKKFSTRLQRVPKNSTTKLRQVPKHFTSAQQTGQAVAQTA